MTAYRAMQIEMWEDGTNFVHIFEMDDGLGDMAGSAWIVDRKTFRADELQQAQEWFRSRYGSIGRIKADKSIPGVRPLGSNYNLICSTVEIWDEAVRLAKAELDARRATAEIEGVETFRQKSSINPDDSRSIELWFPNHLAYLRFFDALASSQLAPLLTQIEEELTCAKDHLEEQMELNAAGSFSRDINGE